MSLADVASQVGISVATLSRIETNKQNLDVELLTKLAHILAISPAEVLNEQTENDRAAVTQRLAGMGASERAQTFLDASRRVDASIEDVLSMLDVLRDELLRMQRAKRSRTRR